MSEEIGRHKGAVETLLHEKKELSRILQIVNSQLERHLSALEDAGVDTDRFIQELQEESQQRQQQAEQQRQQAREQEQKPRSQESHSDNSREARSQGSSSDDEEDIDDFFEDDDDEEDNGNRDFSPY